MSALGIWEDAADDERAIDWVSETHRRVTALGTTGTYMNYMHPRRADRPGDIHVAAGRPRTPARGQAQGRPGQRLPLEPEHRARRLSVRLGASQGLDQREDDEQPERDADRERAPGLDVDRAERPRSRDRGRRGRGRRRSACSSAAWGAWALGHRGHPTLAPVTRDARLLFLARAVRMSGYGALGVILVLYLAAAGLDAGQIGILLTLTLVGDTLISLWLTTHADRIGRRRTLVIGALLMAAAGVVFAGSTGFLVLLVAATLGVLSPSGSEVGPFLPIEQAALTEVTPAERRTSIYAWYNLTGSVATAVGALVAGLVVGALRGGGVVGHRRLPRDPRRRTRSAGSSSSRSSGSVSPAVEVPPVDTSIARRLGLHESRGIVGRLAALFALDAFGGGLIIQSLLAFWFHERFGLPVRGPRRDLLRREPARRGVGARRGADRRPDRADQHDGLHAPAVERAADARAADADGRARDRRAARALLASARWTCRRARATRWRSSIRTSAPRPRASPGIARTTGAALSPLIAAPLFAVPGLAAVPFFLAGGLKIVYDLALWRAFRSRRAPDDPGGVER